MSLVPDGPSVTSKRGPQGGYLPEPIRQIQADFDRIALLPDTGWEHNAHYHPFLLKQLPPRFGTALEIGCGTGSFTRKLAARADQVTALDLSPVMIETAISRSPGYDNIEYHVADAGAWDLIEGSLDCIASIATFHHLSLERMLPRLAAALKPGGCLIALDLYQELGWADTLTTVVALPVDTFYRLTKTGRLRSTPEARQVWAAHGLHDSYHTLAEIRGLCSRALPGACVQRHLLWRYSLVWKKIR